MCVDVLGESALCMCESVQRCLSVCAGGWVGWCLYLCAQTFNANTDQFTLYFPVITSQLILPHYFLLSVLTDLTRKHSSTFSFPPAERRHYHFNERQGSGEQDAFRSSGGDQVTSRFFVCTHEYDPGGGVHR